jgi:hypothetical protein
MTTAWREKIFAVVTSGAWCASVRTWNTTMATPASTVDRSSWPGCMTVLFEGLPSEQRPGWAARRTEATPIGVDLSGVLSRRDLGAKTVAVIEQTTALFERSVAGDKAAGAEWETAEGRAYPTSGIIAAADWSTRHASSIVDVRNILNVYRHETA